MGASKEEETIGKSVIDFFGPEIAKPFIEDDQRIILTGRVIVNREETIVSSTGETKYLLTTKVPIKDKDNKITGIVGISRDITKQKEVELDLRNSKYFLEKAQKVGQIGHWISDRLTGKLTWSEEVCRIFGIDTDNFDGRIETFLNRIHPDDLEKVKSATAYAIEHNEAYSIDHRIILHDGTIKWVHEQGEIMYDEKGKAIALIGVVQDITERKKTENEILKLNNELEEKVISRTEQLMAANEGLEAFSYSVSHDLMTPLRAVSSYSGILKENYESKLDAQGNGLIDRIVANSKKMRQLIDDLLAFARLGRQEVRNQHIDTKLLVESCIEELLHNYPENKFNIKVHSLPSSKGDVGMIKQVWSNLLSNAFKYSSKTEEPKIEIGSIDNESMYTYFVRDNGVGFEMEYVHKLFVVFQRLHRQEEFEGTGVGLALVKLIINKHKGDIWAEASPGKGATFYFSLPVKF
jgi:PAS domain S-box-containing protein